ncbi:hypothetical protein F7725_023960 [Dissostichus mawsoni]|uniref:Uncharacterized protein n=1 Tax=Dissostichus mawsoni TaxID=36200 RepID=A0A7J5XZK0_DISMA|nr:hypothetical protein F7725_023960 [Dissostichus mawsoni]
MSWPLLRMISGATYSGVPQKVHVFFPNPIFLAKPKSTCDKENVFFVRSQEMRVFQHIQTKQQVYLTMKSECASCMMSFSERMCSCCLVSTMCRFFRIFMAKVLFSSLLS